MFNRLFTTFLELTGKACGSLKYALDIFNNELVSVDTVIFNYIGENNHNKNNIYKSVANCYSILNLIGNGDEIELSIKPSQFNYNTTLIEHIARDVNIKRSVLWIDAEEYDQAEKQFKLALDLSSFLSLGSNSKPPNSIGLCLQLIDANCMVYAKKCFDANIRVRLCKGAYGLDERNKRYLWERAGIIVEMHNEYKKDLLEIATIRDIDLSMLALENELPLQILYGYHEKLIDYPYITKVYLPFGTHWWPYIKRRIKEKF